MKLNKPVILAVILFVYSVFLTVFLFPHYRASGQWAVYAGIISAAYILTFLLYRLSKKQQQKDKDEKGGL